MEKPSQEFLRDVEISKNILSAIDKNKREIENIVSSKVINRMTWDNISDLLYELHQDKDNGLENILGSEAWDKFLYKKAYDATIEAKAYCLELSKFSKTILESALENQSKIVLFDFFRLIGLLFDRSDDNYYICEYILRDFLAQLEAFYIALDPEEQKLIIKTVFKDNENEINTKRSDLDQACERMKHKANSDIISVRDADVEDWVASFK